MPNAIRLHFFSLLPCSAAASRLFDAGIFLRNYEIRLCSCRHCARVVCLEKLFKTDCSHTINRRGACGALLCDHTIVVLCIRIRMKSEDFIRYSSNYNCCFPATHTHTHTHAAAAARDKPKKCGRQSEKFCWQN